MSASMSKAAGAPAVIAFIDAVRGNRRLIAACNEINHLRYYRTLGSLIASSRRFQPKVVLLPLVMIAAPMISIIVRRLREVTPRASILAIFEAAPRIGGRLLEAARLGCLLHCVDGRPSLATRVAHILERDRGIDTTTMSLRGEIVWQALDPGVVHAIEVAIAGAFDRLTCAEFAARIGIPLRRLRRLHHQRGWPTPRAVLAHGRRMALALDRQLPVSLDSTAARDILAELVHAYPGILRRDDLRSSIDSSHDTAR